jgi:predicted O-methyltransferase YrrM
MSNIVTGKSNFIDPAVQRYIIATTVHEHPLLAELRELTAQRSNAGMQIGPEQGAFMQLLAGAIGAKRYLEVGVFTGYSSLAMALALPADGKIVACDVSDEYTAVARTFWQRAGVANKIDLRIAPALETLASLVATGEKPFDMAFIDADKANVGNYYEYALQLLRPNGLLLIDNVLWGGAVADASVVDADTAALRAINAKAAGDVRVQVALVPTCDGILMARKLPLNAT